MSASKTAVVVFGSAGRMGARVLDKINGSPDCSLAGAFDLGYRRGPARLEALATAVAAADVAIDFTVPGAGAAHAELCARHKKPLVIGTTGFNADQLALIGGFSKTIPVFLSPNMSPAVNLAIAVARLLAARLPGFDIHISEIHHRLKKDAPSGTALKLKARIKEVSPGEITVASARAGDIVGEHSVLYAGPHERVELTHRAHSRDVFAEGALRAAFWLRTQKPGLYDYADLLGIRNL